MDSGGTVMAPRHRELVREVPADGGPMRPSGAVPNVMLLLAWVSPAALCLSAPAATFHANGWLELHLGGNRNQEYLAALESASITSSFGGVLLTATIPSGGFDCDHDVRELAKIGENYGSEFAPAMRHSTLLAQSSVVELSLIHI